MGDRGECARCRNGDLIIRRHTLCGCYAQGIKRFCLFCDAIIITMRTTLNLPDDVYQAAHSLAALKGLWIGDALAELVRRGLSGGPGIDRAKAFPCFRLPAGAEPVTLEKTLAAEDEL